MILHPSSKVNASFSWDREREKNHLDNDLKVKGSSLATTGTGWGKEENHLKRLIVNLQYMALNLIKTHVTTNEIEKNGYFIKLNLKLFQEL